MIPWIISWMFHLVVPIHGDIHHADVQVSCGCQAAGHFTRALLPSVWRRPGPGTETRTKWPTFCQQTFLTQHIFLTKNVKFLFKFHRILFLMVTIVNKSALGMYWLSDYQVTSHYLNQCWPRCGELKLHSELKSYQVIYVFDQHWSSQCFGVNNNVSLTTGH